MAVGAAVGSKKRKIGGENNGTPSNKKMYCGDCNKYFYPRNKKAHFGGRDHTGITQNMTKAQKKDRYRPFGMHGMRSEKPVELQQQQPPFDFNGMLALVDAADLHEHDPLHGMRGLFFDLEQQQARALPP